MSNNNEKQTEKQLLEKNKKLNENLEKAGKLIGELKTKNEVLLKEVDTIKEEMRKFKEPPPKITSKVKYVKSDK